MSDARKPDYVIEDDGKPVPDAVKAAVIQVTVDERLDQAAVCTIELRDEGGIHSDGSKLKIGSTLKVQLGYVGQTKPVFDGEITGWRGAFPRRGPQVLVVVAHDRLHRLRRTRKSKTYLKMKDSEIVSQIVGDHGLSADAKATGVKHDYVIQANQSDADFLLGRAEVNGYELFVDGKKLVFRPPALDGSAAAKLKWHENLKRFAPTISLGRVHAAVTASAYNPKEKKLVSETAKKGDEISLMGATKPATELAAKVASEPLHQRSVPLMDPQEMKHLAKAILNRDAMKLVTGDGAAQGNPDVRRGTLVEIDAIGDLLSGNYYVHSAIHTLIPGQGYTTSFRVRRTALEKAAPPPPKKPPAPPKKKEQSTPPPEKDVSFVVSNDAGSKMEGLPYLLVLPDGTTESGKLPADGKVEKKQAKPGGYTLEVESLSDPSVPSKGVVGKPMKFGVDVTGLPPGGKVEFQVYEPGELAGDPLATVSGTTSKENPHRAEAEWTYDHDANKDKVSGSTFLVIAKAGETAVSMSQPFPVVTAFEKTIKDKDGKPLKNRKVLLRAARGPNIEAQTDDEGKLSVEVPPGDYRVEVEV